MEFECTEQVQLPRLKEKARLRAQQPSLSALNRCNWSQ